MFAGKSSYIVHCTVLIFINVSDQLITTASVVSEEPVAVFWLIIWVFISGTTYILLTLPANKPMCTFHCFSGQYVLWS